MTNIQDILLTPSGELFLLFQDDAGEDRRGAPLPAVAARADLSPAGGAAQPDRRLLRRQPHLRARPGGHHRRAQRLPLPLLRGVQRRRGHGHSWPMLGFSRPITDRERLLARARVPARRHAGDAFTDTSFAWVNGMAADAAGRVYVAGVIIYCRVDPFNDHVRTLEYRYRIRRYERGSGDRFVVDGPWRRDRSYYLVEGTGFGSTRDPRGMQWAARRARPSTSPTRATTRSSATATRWGAPRRSSWTSAGRAADSMLLAQPLDVAVDSAGYVYVADTGNQRVLRYDPDGSVRGARGPEPGRRPPPLVRPVAITADNRQVYVADRGAGPGAPLLEAGLRRTTDPGGGPAAVGGRGGGDRARAGAGPATPGTWRASSRTRSGSTRRSRTATRSR